MNKYQKALDNVIETYQELERRVGNNPDKVKDFDDIAILQELINKETPMKVDKKDNKKIKCDKFLITLVTYYKCPNKRCEFHNNYNILEGKKRCDECGQKLDWSDTDE